MEEDIMKQVKRYTINRPKILAGFELFYSNFL